MHTHKNAMVGILRVDVKDKKATFGLSLMSRTANSSKNGNHELPDLRVWTLTRTQ